MEADAQAPGADRLAAIRRYAERYKTQRSLRRRERAQDVADGVESPWGRRLLVFVILVILILGGLSTLLQVISLNNDRRDDIQEKVAACRAGFRANLVDQPDGALDKVDTRLTQIQAAGLETLPDPDRRSATSAEPNPYDGLHISELRQLSAQARSDLAAAQAVYDESLARFDYITHLPQADFLTACRKDPEL